MSQAAAIAEREPAEEGGEKRNSFAVRVKAFEKELDLRTATFAQALPEHVPVAKFKRNLITAVVQTPDLLNCFRPSLFQAAMTSASLGLLLDPSLGHGYILPFNDGRSGRQLAQFIPGYRGYLHLARQSGEILSVSAYEVCERDEFDYELGLEERLVHKPALGDRGELRYVYCIVRYKEGGHHIEVMTRADVDRIRSRSKSKNSPAWRDDYAMMARKTVIRRAAKYMPLSVQRAAALDAAYDEGRAARIEAGEIVIDGEAFEVAAEPEQQIERKASKLERFEEEPADPPHDPDTGEIHEAQPERDEPEPQQEPEPAADLPDHLLEEAERIAEQGTDMLAGYWKRLPAADQRKLAPHKERLKQVAAAAQAADVEELRKRREADQHAGSPA